MSKQQTAYKQGRVISLKGLVIKVRFTEDLPDINEMLYIDNEESSPLLGLRLVGFRFLNQTFVSP